MRSLNRIGSDSHTDRTSDDRPPLPPTPPPLPRVDITPLPPADAAAGQAVTDKPKRRRKAYDYGDDQDFLRFWEVFPQKSGKPKAYEAWLAALRRGADPEHVIAAAKHYADDPKRNPEKTKYPQGWLNDERYNDPVPDLNSSGYDNFWDQ